jgi:hypothetical protein
MFSVHLEKSQRKVKTIQGDYENSADILTSGRTLQ